MQTKQTTQTKYDELNSQRGTLRQARETLIADRQQLDKARRASGGAGGDANAITAAYVAGQQVEAKAREIANIDRDTTDIERQLIQLALTVAGIDARIAEHTAQLGPNGYFDVKIRQAQQILDGLNSSKAQAEQSLATAYADRHALAPDDYKPQPGTYHL